MTYYDSPVSGYDFFENNISYSGINSALYVVDIISEKEKLISEPEKDENYPSRVGPAISDQFLVAKGIDKPEDNYGLAIYHYKKSSDYKFINLPCREPNYAHVHGDKLVFNLRCDPIDVDDQINLEVFVYYFSSQTLHRLTELRAQQFVTGVSGQYIVWEDYRKGFCREEVVLYDLKTAQSRQLTDDDIGQFRPDVDGDLVVWTDLRNGTTYPNCSYENSDIYLYRISTGELRRLTTDPHDQEYAVVSGKYVAWTDYRYGSRDPSGVPIQSHVFVHNLETGEEKQVTFGEGFVECCPKISGDRLVYLSYATGGWGALWMIDLKKYWPE